MKRNTPRPKPATQQCSIGDRQQLRGCDIVTIRVEDVAVRSKERRSMTLGLGKRRARYGKEQRNDADKNPRYHTPKKPFALDPKAFGIV
jgi:hypothetical protein